MNLLFRALHTILKAFLFPEAKDPKEAVRTSFRVLPNDLDINRHMNNGRYLTLMDLARVDYLRQVGLFKVVAKKRWSPVLGGAQITFRQSLKLFQKYEIVTRLEHWDEKWFVMSQKFERKGRVYATAYVRGLFKCSRGHVPTSELFKSLGRPLEASDPSSEILAWLDQIQGRKSEVKAK